MVGESENGEYQDSVGLKNFNPVQASYALKGSTWSVQPQIVWDWASAYTLTLGVAYGQGIYPVITFLDGQELEFPKYLETPYEDWQPSLGLTILAKSIFLNLTLDYTINSIPTASMYSMGSSQGMGMDATLFWKLSSWLEIDLNSKLTRRIAASALPGRIENTTSLSLGITSRLP